MSRSKVILLGPLPPPHGGVSVYMSLLAENLKAEGVGVWAYTGGRQCEEARVRCFKHRRLGVVPLLLKEGRGVRVLDATHFHLEHPNPLLLPVWLALKVLLGVRWYKNILDGSLPARARAFSPLRRLLFRVGAACVDEFVVVSEELRRWLREEVKVRQRVTVIPCLLPIPAARLEEPLPPETERALRPYARATRRVCSIGVFIPAYGFRDVAEGVERLRAETGEDVRLVLLDGAFAREDSYREEVLRGREWVTVLENVPNTEVYGVLKRSDVFVRAVEREGYGISRVEAAWCGLPVVATSVGETRGMLVYEFGDVSALAAQMKRALFDPPGAEVSAWAARFRAEAEANLSALKKVLAVEDDAGGRGA